MAKALRRSRSSRSQRRRVIRSRSQRRRVNRSQRRRVNRSQGRRVNNRSKRRVNRSQRRRVNRSQRRVNRSKRRSGGAPTAAETAAAAEDRVERMRDQLFPIEEGDLTFDSLGIDSVRFHLHFFEDGKPTPELHSIYETCLSGPHYKIISPLCTVLFAHYIMKSSTEKALVDDPEAQKDAEPGGTVEPSAERKANDKEAGGEWYNDGTDDAPNWKTWKAKACVIGHCQANFQSVALCENSEGVQYLFQNTIPDELMADPKFEILQISSIGIDYEGLGLCKHILDFSFKEYKKLSLNYIHIFMASATGGGLPSCICYIKAGIRNGYYVIFLHKVDGYKLILNENEVMPICKAVLEKGQCFGNLFFINKDGGKPPTIIQLQATVKKCQELFTAKQAADKQVAEQVEENVDI